MRFGGTFKSLYWGDSFQWQKREASQVISVKTHGEGMSVESYRSALSSRTFCNAGNVPCALQYGGHMPPAAPEHFT